MLVKNIMKKNEAIRLKIFNAFSRNLDLISERYDISFGLKSKNEDVVKINNFYICPLCRNGFFKDRLAQTLKNPLTIEDLPPKSVGRRHLILTCKKCNNTAGSKLDRLIPKQIKAQSFFRENPNADLEASLNFEEGAFLSGKITNRGNNTLDFHIPNLKDDYQKTQFDDLLKNWSKRRFSFQIDVPQQRKADLAYLRIGYLILFKYFGYTFLWDENIRKIGEQLNDPDNRIIDTVLIHKGIRNNDIPEGVSILMEPEELKSYLVVIKPKVDGIESTVGIFIPGPGQKGWENYQALAKNQYKEEFKFEIIPEIDFLGNIRCIDAYYYFFKNTIERK